MMYVLIKIFHCFPKRRESDVIFVGQRSGAEAR
jgi:hypothetical protein